LAEESSFFEKNKVSTGDKPGWIIFLLSLIVSFVLWFFLSLDDIYKNDNPLRIKYINQPNNKVLSFPLPDTISLLVKGKGKDIITFKRWAKENQIIIDLNQYKDRIVLSDFKIRNLLPDKFDKINIVSVKPALISLDYDNDYSTKVSVVSQIKFSCKPEYCTLDQLKIHPSVIEIFGPEKEVKKIRRIYTIDTHFVGLDKNLNRVIKLLKPENPNIRLSTTHVKVSLSVEQMTEGKMNLQIIIPVEFKNKISLIPPKVEIIYQTVLSKYSSINTSDFYPTFSVADIKNSKTAKVKINVDYDSTKIKNIRYNPEFVGFILKNNQ